LDDHKCIDASKYMLAFLPLVKCLSRIHQFDTRSRREQKQAPHQLIEDYQ